MIRVDDLTVRYGPSTVLHNVGFAVAQGESFALVGESGSGKSTILKALSGQVDDWSGQMTVGGQPVTRSRSRAQAAQVQMVFQDPYGSLHPRRTVDDALSEPLAIHGLPDRDARVLAMLDAVGLARRFRFRLPHQLSGGQRQRVAIARALMLSPKVLLLDEPTSALDVSVQAEILNLLKRLRAEQGLTFLLVTHDLPVVSFLCDRLAVLRAGRVVETADVAALRGRALTSDYGRELLARSEGMA
ncbi:ABC transporter ATP-binding protein [Pseudotabrizicola algicola]|uniref:ABC transporter ATP-binding protein n=1 Tax=Pseudotabrizicola algicola TaxID=2709381 RepID=A0A6B3RPW1_9RHOB|nr:ABC transporter ATP-binding protein [Pseudotabrizicola algicola]NEX46798.1 ABC transporter ATP-binding protein [Pseudotabrizicola algicola]